MKLTDEQLREELHALRETPREDFASELDAWAAAGFPPSERDRPTPARQGLAARLAGLRLRPLLPAMGVAATLVVVVIAVGIASLRDSDRQLEFESADPPGITADGGDAGGGEIEGLSEGARDDVEPAPQTAAPPVPPEDELKPGQERVQERSASMTLSTEPEEVDEVADGVVEVAERHEGIVVSSQVSTGDGTGRAKFDLRIPTANLQAALSDLSDLASVSARNEGTLDITAPFVGAEERFEDAKAEVDALLERLADADSATEIASIREQLRTARRELAAARAQLGGLKQRAEFSRLSLTVLGNGDGDGWSIGDAADDALNVLEDLTGATLIALAVLLPLGGLALLGWVAASRLRRHRRESALDE